ncbi:Sister chromatid cohesion protein pds5 [Labeo rohita]|uniref:Sister chromatid cohesion protein pds5 n=1 Tax=Labeo rohita TaxID=84645 RepID=A0ABQ8LA26_LABRO|nr:Sister chromatid cohesion protein pds5 [Labeo rohita]
MSSEKREMHRRHVHAWRTTRQALTRSPTHLECNPPAEVQSLDLPLEEQSQDDVDKEVTSADMEMICGEYSSDTEHHLHSENVEEQSRAVTWEVINSLNESLASGLEEEAEDDSREMSLAAELYTWASEHQIKHNALDNLLKLLQRHGHNELPSTARTLLQTPWQLEQLSGMEYVYFPLTQKLQEALDSYSLDVTELHCLNLLFNIDGSPLYKSSMWPVLCAVMLDPMTSVSRPTDLAFWKTQVTYQETADLKLQTDETFRNQTQVQHHHGNTPLAYLLIDMVQSFPIHYQACLGVMKRLIWTRGDRVVRVSDSQILEISARLRLFGNASHLLLCESLEVLRGWRGKIVLKGILPNDMFLHFLSFSVAMTILVCPSLVQEHSKYAHELLNYFAEKGRNLYGRVARRLEERLKQKKTPTVEKTSSKSQECAYVLSGGQCCEVLQVADKEQRVLCRLYGQPDRLFTSPCMQINLRVICKELKGNTILVKIDPSGSIYRGNNIGARIDPCGTPQADDNCKPHPDLKPEASHLAAHVHTDHRKRPGKGPATAQRGPGADVPTPPPLDAALLPPAHHLVSPAFYAIFSGGEHKIAGTVKCNDTVIGIPLKGAPLADSSQPTTRSLLPAKYKTSSAVMKRNYASGSQKRKKRKEEEDKKKQDSGK